MPLSNKWIAMAYDTPLLAPVGPTPIPVDRFTLLPIKSGSDYLQTWDLILFWHRSLLLLLQTLLTLLQVSAGKDSFGWRYRMAWPVPL